MYTGLPKLCLEQLKSALKIWSMIASDVTSKKHKFDIRDSVWGVHVAGKIHSQVESVFNII